MLQARQQSKRRCSRVPAPTWPSPGADVAESRRRHGRVPAPMWPSPGADVGRAALAQPGGPIGERDVQRRRRVRCSAIEHRPLPSRRMNRIGQRAECNNVQNATCIMQRATCAVQDAPCHVRRATACNRKQAMRIHRPDEAFRKPTIVRSLRTQRIAFCTRSTAQPVAASQAGACACAGAVTTQRQRPFPSASKDVC
jgi:hypothetical protein